MALKLTVSQYALGDLVSCNRRLGHREARFVDEAGRLIRVTDAHGAVTAFENDAHDQLTKDHGSGKRRDHVHVRRQRQSADAQRWTKVSPMSLD